MTATVEYFIADTDLFQIFLSGVCVICIYDHSRILEVFLLIQIIKDNQILIVIIRNGSDQRIHCTTQNRMGIRLACCLYFPATV